MAKLHKKPAPPHWRHTPQWRSTHWVWTRKSTCILTHARKWSDMRLEQIAWAPTMKNSNSTSPAVGQSYCVQAGTALCFMPGGSWWGDSSKERKVWNKKANGETGGGLISSTFGPACVHVRDGRLGLILKGCTRFGAASPKPLCMQQQTAAQFEEP